MTPTKPDEVSRHRVEDSRARELICATGNPDLFREMSIPRSPNRGWLNGEHKVVVGAERVSHTELELYAENAKLR
ncbi:hypothetical protein ACFL5O_04750 [Myxococcota bacterium]